MGINKNIQAFERLSLNQKMNYLFQQIINIKCCGSGGSGTGGSTAAILVAKVDDAATLTSFDPLSTLPSNAPTNGSTTWTPTVSGNPIISDYDYFKLERNGQGTLIEGIDYSVTGNTITLLGGFMFNTDEVYTITFYNSAS